MLTFYKRTKQLSLLALITVSTSSISAQDHVFSFGLGSSANDAIYAVSQDSAHNVYVAGTYSGTVDFDPSPNTNSLSCPFAPCGCVAKYDSLGNFIWAKSLEAGTGGPLEIHAIDFNSSGNMILSGWFMGTCDFDPSANTNSLTSNGVHDVFMAEYDTDGNYVWAKNFGGPAPDYLYDMAVDDSDNIIVTGFFITMADFDPSPNTFTLNGVSGSPDVFLAKYNPTGDLIWAKNFGADQQDEGHDLALDQNGNIFVTGVFRNSGDFDPGMGSTVLTSNGLRDIFIVKFDGDGVFQWAHSFGDAGEDGGYSVETDEFNNAVITGYFNNTVDFDPGAGTASLSANGQDLFVLMLDENGNYKNAFSIGGSNDDEGKDIVYDKGYYYLTGTFSGSNVDFDPGTGTADLSSIGWEDVFIAKYDTTGNYFWAKAFGSDTNETSTAVWIESSQNIYVTGTFIDTIDFDFSSGVADTFSNGGSDGYLAKYNFCLPIYNSLTEIICLGDTFYFGGIALTNGGTYFDTIQSVMGCDSFVDLTLTVDAAVTSVVQTNHVTLMSQGTGTYQWLDCDNGMSQISGATSQSYIAQANGNYAVIVTNTNGCVDTSACYEIDSVGVGVFENQLSDVLTVYPNPAHDKLSFESNQPLNLILFDSYGRAIRRIQANGQFNSVNISDLSAGIYYLNGQEYNGTIMVVINN